MEFTKMKNDSLSKVKTVKIQGSDHEKWQNLFKLSSATQIVSQQLSLSWVIEFEIDVNNLKSKT